MYKIHFDRKKKGLVDEVNAAFTGTRVSDVVSTTKFEILYQKLAEEKALEKVLERAAEYGADTYELLSLESKSNHIQSGLLFYEATANVIFYQSTTKKGE